jgi:hypothetical protein
MRKLNPEIEKFWTDTGHTIHSSSQGPSDLFKESFWCVTWTARKDNDTTAVAVTETIGPKGKTIDNCEILYSWGPEYTLYSEEEMLRMIKLKVFL